MDSKEILEGLIWFCLAVWYLTADILGIFCSFFLSLAIFVFSFLLVIFYNWYQEDLSHFRATRAAAAMLRSRRMTSTGMTSTRVASADEQGTTFGLNQELPPPSYIVVMEEMV